MESLFTATKNGYTVTVDYEQWADDPTNWGNFEIAQWRDIDGIDVDTRSISKELQAKIDDGRAFWIDKYEHGGVVYSVSGDGMQCRFDTTKQWGLIVFTDEYASNFDTIEGRREMAKQDLKTYTDWANGDVYSVSITDENGEYIDGQGDCYDLDATIADAKANLDHLAPVHAAAAAPSARSLHK